MRSAALLVALFDVVIGIAGVITSPESMFGFRRQYLATPLGLYAVGAFYLATGLVLVLFAPASRAPKTLRAFGALLCLRGIAAPLFGVDRAMAVLDWEEMQTTAVLRVGSVVALAIGGLLGFAASAGPRLKRSSLYRTR